MEGCASQYEFDVPSPPAVAVFGDSLSDIRCFGGKDGYLRVSGKGGTAPYQYFWENGFSSPVRESLGKGIYRVSIQDVNGCVSTSEFEIGGPAALKVFVAVKEWPICPGDSSGMLEAVGQGGRMPYRFFWKNGIEGPVLRNAGVGEYRAWALDSNGCQSDTAVVSVVPPEGVRWNASVVPPLCKGRSEGQISLQPFGRAPFRYLWGSGDTTSMLSGLSEGRYTVSVQDAAGCRYDTVFELGVRETPIKLGIIAISPSCTGGSDGLIRLEPQQVAYPPLVYRWDNGTANRERNALREGNYEVTITDGAGCRQIEAIRLDNPAPLSYQLTAVGEIACKGDSTGFLELLVQGGVPPYTYRWIGSPSTGPSAYRLGAGEYRFFARDSKGCPLDANFILQEPPAIQLLAEVSTGNICEGDTSNQLKAIFSGGVPPYSLRWNNGKTEQVLNNVPAGDYSFSVQDGNGCQQVLPTFKVRDLGKPLELANFQVRDISCFGEKDGSINVAVRGGRPPYTYVFKGTSTTVQTFQAQWSITGLSPRNSYGVVISDAFGCRVETADRPLREPPLLSVRRDSVQLVNCFGPNTGAIFVSAGGGTPPYAFNWFDEASGREVATTEDLISFPGGNYRLVVTDSRLCSDTLYAINIPTRSSLRLSGSQVTDNPCRGDRKGSIMVDLEGGRSPYSYFWNGKVGSASLSGAAAGSYELVVVDADSCRTALPIFQIAEPAQGIEARAELTAVNCPGGQDGRIKAVLSGVQGVFQAIWTNAGGQQIALDTLRLDSLRAGLYRLQVRDQKGCSAAFGYEVVEPEALKLSWKSTLPGPEANSGELSVQISGGTSPYRFRWNTGDTTAALKGLSPGLYMLSITDARGCMVKDSFSLISTRISGFAEEGPFGKLFPNPAASGIFLELNFRQRPVRPYWQVTDLRGQVVLAGTLKEDFEVREEIRVEGLPPSWYVLVVYDAFGRVWREKWIKL